VTPSSRPTPSVRAFRFLAELSLRHIRLWLDDAGEMWTSSRSAMTRRDWALVFECERELRQLLGEGTIQ
jgi:hypothetical protein